MVAFGIISEQEARDSINWEVYITVACAFGIGTALVNSGVAGGIAGFLVKIGTSLGIGGMSHDMNGKCVAYVLTLTRYSFFF
jgi:di/tricarboxylate transporter